MAPLPLEPTMALCISLAPAVPLEEPDPPLLVPVIAPVPADPAMPPDEPVDEPLPPVLEPVAPAEPLEPTMAPFISLAPAVPLEEPVPPLLVPVIAPVPADPAMPLDEPVDEPPPPALGPVAPAEPDIPPAFSVELFSTLLLREPVLPELPEPSPELPRSRIIFIALSQHCVADEAPEDEDPGVLGPALPDVWANARVLVLAAMIAAANVTLRTMSAPLLEYGMQIHRLEVNSSMASLFRSVRNLRATRERQKSMRVRAMGCRLMRTCSASNHRGHSESEGS